MRTLLPRILLVVSLVASARAADFATTMMDATFKFYHSDSTSTCFLVQRGEEDSALYLITTAHTVERTKGETAVLVLRVKKDDGSYARHDHTITIRKGEEPLWVRHAKEDVAVMRLADPMPVKVAALPERMLAEEAALKAEDVHLCSRLFVLTYPQRFEANGAGMPVARQGIFASPPLLPWKTHPTFLADFTTFAGDSGGPVFIESKEGHPAVAGIVINQHHHEEKVNGEYEERLIRYPLGMGTVLRSDYLRETLAKAAESK